MDIGFMGVAGEARGIGHMTDLPIGLFINGVGSIWTVPAKRLGRQNDFCHKSNDSKNH